MEAEFVSPVDREDVQIRIKSGKHLTPVTAGNDPLGYKGPMQAGVSVNLQLRFLALEAGIARVPAFVGVNLNRVDSSTYSAPLYIRIHEDGGEASSQPFPDPYSSSLHTLPGE